MIHEGNVCLLLGVCEYIQQCIYISITNLKMLSVGMHQDPSTGDWS